MEKRSKAAAAEFLLTVSKDQQPTATKEQL
jgi:hypothetical protein